MRGRILIALLFLAFASNNDLLAQRKSSPVFRNSETANIPLVLPSTLDFQLLEAFVLLQKANAGEPLAQHELGLRYLFGKGFPPDTAKAALWIRKAADQHLPIANYNLGILYMQGCGVPWNPFEAFKYFQAAAADEMPEAQYVLGLTYSENLVVPRNWPKVYEYIKASADQGFEAAKVVLGELRRRGLDSTSESRNVASSPDRSDTARNSKKAEPAFNLVYIDFHSDTTTTVADTTLIREAYRDIHASSDDASNDAPAARIDSTVKSQLSAAAAVGCPEALCVIGRCYEEGIGVPRDLVLAAVYYLQAMRLDSYRAPALLWKMMNTEEFSRLLGARSAVGDPAALYVWSGLTAVGFSKLLNEKQAFDLIQRAARAGHPPSMVDLGSCYFTGRWVQQDVNQAVEWWNRASLRGSIEADIRLAAANILGQVHTESPDSALSLLRSAAQEGSLLSDLAVGYCYEKGIVVRQNKGEAYNIYHKAMMRGSESAYRSIRRMCDELRPDEREFRLSD
jgi:TPR repeat protein